MKYSQLLYGILGLAFIGTLGWLIKEIKNAPEMYFTKDGSFHTLEWFEQNNQTDNMYYDENGMEKFPYEYFKKGNVQ